jgi:hypothetical protein
MRKVDWKVFLWVCCMFFALDIVRCRCFLSLSLFYIPFADTLLPLGPQQLRKCYC